MDANGSWTAGLEAGVLLGVLLAVLLGGLVVAAHIRWRGRGRAGAAVRSPTEPAQASAGVGDVLAALGATAVLLDTSDSVVQATPSSYALGLVRNGRLTSAPLRRLAREVRRDGRVREADLVLATGPFGARTLAVSARAALLRRGLVLMLVEDRTEALRVDAVRRDFVANVSHELKTPVGALSLLAEAVLDARDDPDAVARFAGRMQYEASRLSQLVQEIIDLSRLQAADPLQEAQVVSVDDVVAEAVERVRLAAAAKSISLVTGGEPGLTVLGEKDQLVTAVRNLVENAVSYSAEHTRVAVGVRSTRDDLVEIGVTDQGMGIPEGDLQRIFERFYRVDPARSRATGGTGLGLSIVKHITENHGGEVRVWSMEGSGSTFTLRLPGRASRAHAPERSADPPPPSRTPSPREART